MNIYDFLNGLSAYRLVFYGLIFIISIGYVTAMVESIFKSIFSRKKFKNEETLDRGEAERS